MILYASKSPDRKGDRCRCDGYGGTCYSIVIIMEKTVFRINSCFVIMGYAIFIKDGIFNSDIKMKSCKIDESMKREDGMKDYYQILGVRRDASSGEIKKVYRKLAKRYHPDSHQEDEQAKQRFQEISEAYKVLSDEKARKQYNAWGHEAYTSHARHMSQSERDAQDGHCGACGDDSSGCA